MSSTSVRPIAASVPPPAPRPGLAEDSRPVHLTRRGRLLVLAGLVLLLLAAFAAGRAGGQAAGAAGVAAAGAPQRQLEQVTVRSGDSLWTVAQRLAPGRDVRPVVGQLRELNDLERPALQVGQQLLVPTDQPTAARIGRTTRP